MSNWKVHIYQMDVYQKIIKFLLFSDNHRPNFTYHMISFIQREPTSIIRWVVNIYLMDAVYISRWSQSPNTVAVCY